MTELLRRVIAEIEKLPEAETVMPDGSIWSS